MRKLKLLFLASVTAALSASTASAQACLGLPSFENGSVHLNVSGQFPEAAKAYAVGLGTGRPNNLFANFGAGQVTFDDFTGKQTLGFLEFGGQVPAGPAQFCPVAGGYLAKGGPNDDAAGSKESAYGATVGVALGLPVSLSFFKVIPNVAVKYEFAWTKYEDASGSDPQNFKSAAIDLGLGFVLFDRFSIQPLARIPIATDVDEKTSYGVFASVSFPWRAQ